MEPQVDITQRCPESRSDGKVLNTMAIQSAVALRLTPGPANQPGVPLDDSLHPRLLTAVAFATLEISSLPLLGYSVMGATPLWGLLAVACHPFSIDAA